jgi:hypothetical protein
MTQRIRLDIHGLGAVGLFGMDNAGRCCQGAGQRKR